MNTKLKIAVAATLTLFLHQTTFAQQIAEKDLKQNIEEINTVVSKITKLIPISYTYNTNHFKKLNLPENIQYGFKTEQASQIFPHLVTPVSKVYSAAKNTTKVATFDQLENSDLIPLLVAAIKEQQVQIERLQELIKAMKNETLKPN